MEAATQRRWTKRTTLVLIAASVLAGLAFYVASLQALGDVAFACRCEGGRCRQSMLNQGELRGHEDARCEMLCEGGTWIGKWCPRADSPNSPR